jgi:hypothetical protein
MYLYIYMYIYVSLYICIYICISIYIYECCKYYLQFLVLRSQVTFIYIHYIHVLFDD